MLNSAEYEILNAHKYENIKKFSFFQAQIRLECLVFLLINVKMPTVVGILTILSVKMPTVVGILTILSRKIIHAQLS